ncbi:MAG: DHA2 family efflux MFS transporter permease subunit [Burkholderiaceae bacterium]
MAPPETQPPPLTGLLLVLGTLAMSLGVFMNVLDMSIANVSLPTIAGDLGVSPNQGTWIITSFAVANAISIPLTGWLTERIGQVRLFVASTVLFTLASWLCGLAPNIETLIAARILQGAVCGPMIPLSQSLLLSSYPKSKAGLAMAMWGMTMLVAPVVGPLLGGWITETFSWPWIFYINIPIGFGSAALTWALYKNRETRTQKLPIDKIGLVLLVVWVGALQILLDKGKELDWFASPVVITLAVVAAVGLAVFIVWELTDDHPIVDLSLFRERNFLVGTVAMGLAFGAYFGNVVLLPLWLQQFMGYTATWAGLVTAPVGILAIVVSPIVGKKIDTTDARMIVTVSFLIFAVVMWMRSQFNTSVDPQTILLPIVIQGIALATFFVPLITLTLSGLPPERIPAASGLSNFVRIIAGAFGTSIGTTLWEDRATFHRSRMAEGLSEDNPVLNGYLEGFEAHGVTQEQGLAIIDRLAVQQAYTIGIDEIFLASAALYLLMIPLLWFARPAQNQPA